MSFLPPHLTKHNKYLSSLWVLPAEEEGCFVVLEKDLCNSKHYTQTQMPTNLCLVGSHPLPFETYSLLEAHPQLDINSESLAMSLLVFTL